MLVKKILLENALRGVDSATSLKDHITRFYGLNGLIEPASLPVKPGYVRLYHYHLIAKAILDYNSKITS